MLFNSHSASGDYRSGGHRTLKETPTLPPAAVTTASGDHRIASPTRVHHN